MEKLSALAKSPLFHFVFFGVLLFTAYSLITDTIARQNKTVRVDATQVQMQREYFKKTWNREPNEEELKAQIENIVMDEIFYKEAVALGLDKSDPAIKRRLRQMMEMMFEDYSTQAPNENQLRTYLNAHKDKFRRESRLSFEHLYFDYEDINQAEELLPLLKGNEALAEKYRGGLSMIPDTFKQETSHEIRRYFGNDFTQLLFESDLKGWFGPVASSYGYHLVKVSEQLPGELPELNEIWSEVEREWSAQQKVDMREAYHNKLKERYEVVIETSAKL